MPTMADVVQQHGPAYVQQYGTKLLPSHARAMRDIVGCRTAALGGHLSRCQACGEEHLLYHSCRSRACPRCGRDRARAWVDKQAELLLPVTYFHVVFTLPAELRRLVREHQRALIPVLFRAAYESLAVLCRDSRHLGGDIGALGVLHTWSRTLEWHPHVHFLVPGGALSPSGQWFTARRVEGKPGERYLVPVRALSAGFRGRFLRRARRALPDGTLPWLPDKPWVAYAKPALHGARQVLAYLGRYVHRTTLAERALMHVDERAVRLRYQDHRDHQRKTMTLSGSEFLRRYLQHVPPRGLHRVRAFGLLHRSKRATLQRLQLMLKISTNQHQRPRTRASNPCPRCGGALVTCSGRLTPARCVVLARQRGEPIPRGPPHPKVAGDSPD